MALEYDFLQNGFRTFETVETPKVEINFPLLDEPIDISSWAKSVTPEGSITVQSRLPRMINNSETPTQGIAEQPEYTTSNSNNKMTSQKQKENALIIMNNLVQRGYKPHVAAGIVGNLIAESSLNPNSTTNDLGKISGGLAQWRGDLFKNLKSEAKTKNVPWNDINFQLDYLHNILNRDKGVLDRLNKATNAEEASEAWAYYEKYAGYDGTTKTAKKAGWSQKRVDEEHQKRKNYSNEVYQLWNNQA